MLKLARVSEFSCQTDENMTTRSDSRRYVLLYGDVELGEVTQQDSDFPKCFGIWRPYSRADDPEIRSFIRAYIQFSEHGDSLRTPDITPAREAYTLEREQEFLDLIESPDWALRDEDGVRHPVLVPVFSVDGEIGWAWNFSRACPPDIESEISFVATEQGGRSKLAFSGYGTKLYYDGHHWDADQEYPDVGRVLPGQTVRALVRFASPDMHVGRLRPGSEFQVRKDEKVVARGRVTKITHLEESAERFMGKK